MEKFLALPTEEQFSQLRRPKIWRPIHKQPHHGWVKPSTIFTGQTSKPNKKTSPKACKTPHTRTKPKARTARQIAPRGLRSSGARFAWRLILDLFNKTLLRDSCAAATRRQHRAFRQYVNFSCFPRTTHTTQPLPAKLASPIPNQNHAGCWHPSTIRNPKVSFRVAKHHVYLRTHLLGSLWFMGK